jgi:hypothetical protein
VSAQAFVDESARGRAYYVCAAIIADGDVGSVRQSARRLCLPGQRRWHFAQERDSRRRQIIEMLVRSGQLQALIFHGKGSDTAIRADSFARMVPPLREHAVTHLVIESRQGRDQADRQALLATLRAQRLDLRYEHMPPHADPLLWAANAIAWCASAGGVWRERLAPLVTLCWT